MRRAHVLGVFLGAFFAATACDPIEPPYRLDRPRLLGAKVVVVADPNRASVRPGDAVIVETFTASAARDRGAFASAAFTVCAAIDDPIEARCAGPRFGDGVANGPDDPKHAFTVPRDFTGKMLVFATFCIEGEASIAAAELRGACTRGFGQDMVVRFEVGAADHRHPSLPAGAIVVDGVPLPDRRGRCGDGATTVRADGLSHTVTIEVAGLEPSEVPLVSHVVTIGKLEGLYSSSGDDGKFRVDWEIPADFAGERFDARIHVVVRDGRGGTAARVADVCLEKGAPR